MERDIQRAIFDIERAEARVLDPAGHGVPMTRAPEQCLEHKDVERSLQQVEIRCGHCFPGSVPGKRMSGPSVCQAPDCAAAFESRPDELAPWQAVGAALFTFDRSPSTFMSTV